MKIFLCGQKYFGQKTLEMILDRGHEVVGVCSPVGDRLWRRAQLVGVRVMVPGGTLSADNMPLGADLIVAAHSYDFIGLKTLGMTKLGGIGFHPSLLPLHRGRDAIRWSIKMGDRVTGGSVYWLTKSVDAGPIAAQDWCFIAPGETHQDLWREKLQPMGLRLLGAALDDLSRGVIIAKPQDESCATWEPSFDREPIFRPDLARIGAPPEGFIVHTHTGRAGWSDVVNSNWKRIAGG